VLPVLAAVAVGGTAATLVATGRYGPALSADSYVYVMGAETLRAGRGYELPGEGPVALWPPMMSALLLALTWLGAEPVAAGRVLNAALLGGTVFLAGVWVRRHARSPALAVAAGLLVAVCPVLGIARWLWSEMLFIFLLVAYAALLTELCARPGYVLSALAGAVVAAACMTRYIGAAAVPVGVALCLLAPGVRLRRRLALAVVHGAVASAPLGAWLARNYVLTGTLTGAREAAKSGSLAAAIQQLGQVLREWTLPFDAASGIPPLVFVAALAAVLLAALVLAAPPLLAPRGSRRLSPMLPPLLIVLLYLAGIVSSIATVSLARITTRFLSPICVPMILVVLCGCKDVADRLRSSRPRWAGRYLRPISALVMLVLLGGVALASVRALSLVRGWAARGAGGYSSPRWADSEVSEYVRAGHASGTVFSNHPDALYFATGAESQGSPSRWGEADPPPDHAFFRALAEGRPVYLVWYEPHWRDYVAPPEQLRTACELTLLKACSDGAVYLCRRSGT